MNLKELILSVRDPDLSKEALEAYRDEISNLYAQMHWELADVKKAKALFIIEHPERSDKATERKWQVTEKGLREIELNHYIKATEEILRSTKTRLFTMYE